MTKGMRETRIVALTLMLPPASLFAQTVNSPKPPADPPPIAGIPVNYDEAKVGTYTLPDPLVLNNGKPVRDAKTWYGERRPEIVKMFEEIQYGRAPGRPANLWFKTTEAATPALGGKALRKRVTVYFTKDSAGPKVDLLVYLPPNARGPVPMLLHASFGANSATVNDSGVARGMVWGRDGQRVEAPARPGQMNPVPFLEQGIGIATLYYGDIEPDFLAGLPLGIRSTYLKSGQTATAADEWGTVSAWAWGLSRVMDYFETDPLIDAKRVALLGVSRLGKTVLWAGAHDTRFAMVIASCSGESGAALSRRNYGETVAHMTAPTRYGYQFAPAYASFGTRVSELPMDGHMLVSLIAPRPLLLQTGDADFWSDPKGEFLAAVAAGPVFRLLGVRDLETTEMPPVGQPIFHTLSFYEHSGGHGMVASDWDVFLKFMQLHFQNK